MEKKTVLLIILPFISIILLLFSIAYSDEKSLIDLFLTESNKPDNSKKPITKNSDYISPLIYSSDDWEKFVDQKNSTLLKQSLKGTSLFQNDDFQLMSYGKLKMNLKYGDSIFTNSKYKQFIDDKASSRVITSGFLPEQDFKLHLEGKIGKRLTLYIDHDSEKQDNRYVMKYKALHEEELIQEVNAGEVDVLFNKSKYATYKNNPTKGLGMDILLRKDKFQLRAFGTITQGNSAIELFKGNSISGNYTLNDYQYIKRTYYQIESHIRYGVDPVVNPGEIVHPADPENYSLTNVNIDPSSFELYIDDQDPYNNTNAVTLSLDNGKYTKLVNGADYSVNYITGLIKLKKYFSESSRIFALYNLSSGSSTDPYALPTTDPNHPGGIFSGKIFVFIKYNKSITETIDINGDGKLSKDIYEVKSFYYIGDKNLISNDFNLLFYENNSLITSGSTGLKALGKYNVDYGDGIISFTIREPFKGLTYSNSDEDKIYAENQSTNVYDYSRYNMKINYYKEARSFKLKHFNLIPNSVKIKIDNRVIPQSLYTIDYTSGFLMFNNPDNPMINPETIIEVRYEYFNQGTESNSFAGGLRADYKFNKNLNFGGSVLYIKEGGSEIIPDIRNAPDQTILIEGDASLNLDEKTISKLAASISNNRAIKVPVEIKGYAEYAKSYRSVNTFGKGLIDNFESTEEISLISLSEKDWILSSMPSGGATRGQLFYYFFRDLSDPLVLQRNTFSATKIDYSVKPGPFNLADGHISDSIQDIDTQRALVMDFSFGAGETVIPIVTRRLANGSVDFSGLQYVEVWYKYEGAGSIDLKFDLGKINEDSDNDGVHDSEDLNSNSYLETDPDNGYNEDIGYDFNGNHFTVIGSGAKLNSETQGNGILNSEDLNGNGLIDTTESIYSVPNGNSVTTDFQITDTSSQWIKKRIYIGQPISDTDIDILKDVEAIRMYITGVSNTTGRLSIDSIRFVSSRWKNVEENSVSAGPDKLSATIINSINDSEYRTNSFLFNENDKFESLYGQKNSEELEKESESALELAYSTVSGNNVSIERKFSSNIDLRHYKTLNLWINYRSFTSGDKVGIQIGSSENDYREYIFSMDYTGSWREIKLKLKESSSGDVEINNVVGSPDLKRVNFIKTVIYVSGVSGKLWLNDIYASESETLSSSASWYEGEIKIKKPLYKTDKGITVLSDINIKYVQRGNGSNFSTIGKPVNELKEDIRDLYTSLKILPNWSMNFDFHNEETESEDYNEDVDLEKRGKSSRNIINVSSKYDSKSNAIPSFSIQYKSDNFSNEKFELIADQDVQNENSQYSHAPVFTIVEKIDKFLWGTFKGKIMMDMLFKSEEISRSSEVLSQQTLASYTSVLEKEKRQRANSNVELLYNHKKFYIRQNFAVSSEEVVEKSGSSNENSTEITGDINSGFHFPFIYNSDFKFIKRDKKLSLKIGLKEYLILPVYSMEMHYYENKFRDYSSNEHSYISTYSRAKDAMSTINSKISIPVNVYKIKKFKFIKALNFSYSRSLFFTENDIPYEGEDNNSFDEKFGISRPSSNILNGGLNLVGVYPGYFFLGRGNYSNARDYLYDKLNSSINFSDGVSVPDYNNSIKLIDSFSFRSSYDFKKVNLYMGLTFAQVCERIGIYGIPQQVISKNFDIKLNFNLMKLFDFGFFRPNKKGLPFHSSNLYFMYTHSSNSIITSNILTNSHLPGIGFNIKWDRSNVNINGKIDIKNNEFYEYINVDSSQRNSLDNIYITNMEGNNQFQAQDLAYEFSIIYETDVKWIYKKFLKLHKLVAFPIFTVEYTLKLNKYDYTNSVSPEPYDLHFLSGKLTLDLHKNIQGGIESKLVLEKFRNRETDEISKEVFSYEISASLSLIF